MTSTPACPLDDRHLKVPKLEILWRESEYRHPGYAGVEMEEE